METTIPSATVVLRGGDRIILKHVTTDQFLEIYRAVTATRHASTNETDSSEDSTTKVQSVRNAKRRERRQTLTASRKAKAATEEDSGASGAEPTSTEEADDRATVAPHPSTEEDTYVLRHHPSYDAVFAAAAVLAEEDDVDVDDVEMDWTMPSRVHPSYDLAAATDEAENIETDKAAQEESQLDEQAFDEQEMTPVMPMEGADEGGASPSGYQSMEGANAGFGVTAAEYSRYLLHGGPLPEGLPGGKFQRSGWFLLEPGDGAEWNRVMGLPADSLLMLELRGIIVGGYPPPRLDSSRVQTPWATG